MFGLRWRTDCTARRKKGPPAHSTMGTDSASSTQLCMPMLNHCRRWPNMASNVTATVSGSVHQKRRRKSVSSGFSSSSSAGSTGSNVMPHFGQLPGRSCRTSGCIGQV